MEAENILKNRMKIYEDQTQIQQFVEPEWMKILRVILEENKHIEKTKRSIFIDAGR